MIPKKKPEEHLYSATYSFEQDEMIQIVHNWLSKKCGRDDIQFHISSDEEDETMRIDLCGANEENEELWTAVTTNIPEWEDEYALPIRALSDYMHVSVLEITAYLLTYRPYVQRFFVEVSPHGYVEHVNIHDWGF